MNGVNLAGSAAWSTAVFFFHTAGANAKAKAVVIFDVREWTAGDWTCCTLLICTIANAALSKSKLGVAANLTGSVIVIVKWTNNRRSDLNLEHANNNALQTEHVAHMGTQIAQQALQIQTHQQTNETQRQLVEQQTLLAQQEGQRAAQFAANAEYFQTTANQLRDQMTAECQQRATLEQTLRENQATADALREDLAGIQGLDALREELVRLQEIIPQQEQRLEDLTQELEKAGQAFVAKANESLIANNQMLTAHLGGGSRQTGAFTGQESILA